MSGGPVGVEDSDGITTVVLDDPGARNALSWELVRALSEAVEGTVARASRALVLRNTPPVFCAGGSVDELLEPKVGLEEIHRAFHALDEAPMPTVAAIDGAAIGAGITLLLCCDLAICTPASRFDLRFLDVGIHPGGGALWRLDGW
jgi:enoyl-CoA hydratase